MSSWEGADLMIEGPSGLVSDDFFEDLHRRSIVVDAHCDSLGCVLRGERLLNDYSHKGHVDVPRLLEGGVTAQVFACGLHALGPRSNEPTRLFLRMADVLYQEIERSNGKLTLCTSASDILQAKKNKNIAAILGMEDAAPLAGDLGILRMFFKLGLRVIGLVWGPPNEVGDGVSERTDEGDHLKPFGISLIQEMNRLGILIDVAHLNEKGFWDVIEHSKDPIINSHSNARHLYNHPRNLTDSQIIALAEHGGVIHVTFTFLDADPKKCTLDRVLDHIDYIAGMVGPEHVGIGSDFDGLSTPLPLGIEDARSFPKITKGLGARGYNQREIQLILGGNFVRIFRAVTEKHHFIPRSC